MEDNLNTSKNVIFSYDEPVQNLFKKIKHFDIEYQVAFAAAVNGPKRSELFDIIMTSMNDPLQKKNVQLIKDRLAMACSNIPGYTLNEVEHYKDIFINDLSGVLHSSNIEDYINDKIRELQFRHDRLEMDLKDKIRDGAPYSFLDDRKLNQDDIIETVRYKNYLENLINLFSGTTTAVFHKGEPGEEENLENPVTFRVIGRFCRLVADSELKPRGEQSVTSFCKEVCSTYNLQYTDNVRQWYSNPDGKQFDLDVVSYILSKIPAIDAKAIKKHLDKKNPPKQKLYG
jgi:hypothetical protein